MKANVGLVFGIVVDKNRELPEHDPKRKYKGRSVFQGNIVWDEEGNWAASWDLVQRRWKRRDAQMHMA